MHRIRLSRMEQADDQTPGLGALLRRHGEVWFGHCCLGNRSDIEIEVSGNDAAPSVSHLKYAAECVTRLPQLLPDLEASLNAVKEDHPLFPTRQRRRWYLEGLSFTGTDAYRGEARFTLEEAGYDYVYVLYCVEIVDGRVGDVHAHTY